MLRSVTVLLACGVRAHQESSKAITPDLGRLQWSATADPQRVSRIVTEELDLCPTIRAPIRLLLQPWLHQGTFWPGYP
jgi:hypothetical protein